MFKYFKKPSRLRVLIYALSSSVLTLTISYFIFHHQAKKEVANAASTYVCSYDISRLDGLKYTRPLMFVDEKCESEHLLGLKQRLIEIIDKYKKSGDAKEVSVYLKEYNNNEWTSIDDNKLFDPGSLFKVPVLITILKMNEDNPGFLDKKIKYEKQVETGKNVAYKSKTIQLGNSYTVRELLTYMIKYSDNNATILVESLMKPEVIQKLFTDIGLEAPSMYAKEYLFTTRQYSLFFRAIYNAAYLTIKDSEFAGELLSQTDFKDGIIKGLPSNIKLMHKFGEAGNQFEKQLHETGIIYLNSNPYLLSVMTKGKDNAQLSKLIGEISAAVYLEMANRQTSMVTKHLQS
jgi:beta-lactamase class A